MPLALKIKFKARRAPIKHGLAAQVSSETHRAKRPVDRGFKALEAIQARKRSENDHLEKCANSQNGKDLHQAIVELEKAMDARAIDQKWILSLLLT